MVVAAALSLIAWAALEVLVPRPAVTWSDEMRDASERMQEAITVVAEHHQAAGIEIDETVDPNRTGLVGPDYTELFTTLGDLEAKRTTTTPDMAALLVHLLRGAGIGAGDTVAVGASGSFPALLIATLTAAEAIGARPVVIVSLGASSYGATRPELDLLRIYRLVHEADLISTPPSAVSLGGEADVGADFEPAFREALLERARAAGVPVVDEPDLRRNVARRMAIYAQGGAARAGKASAGQTQAGSGRPEVFVNIGGNEANLGTSPLVLNVPPGTSDRLLLPAEAQRGVLYEMSSRGIPVIHLLHIRGLALEHSLPWDPIPLPEPGSTPLTRGGANRGWRFWLIAAAYLGGLVVIALGRRPGRVKKIG
jgi:poly-gamma-glutamate system protein